MGRKLSDIRTWNDYQYSILAPLQWRHNQHVGVSNHQPHDCLLHRLFRRSSKQIPKLRVTGLCEGNSPYKGPLTRKSVHLMTSSCSLNWFLCTCRRGNHLLSGIRQPKQNIPSHLPRSLEDIMLSVQFISTQNVWLHLIKMLTMSGDHWWLIIHVPETVLVDNSRHCFKPIPTYCNSFAGNVSRMWLNIHSAWAQDIGQLSEAWWMTSIWRSNRKVVIKQCI